MTTNILDLDTHNEIDIIIEENNNFDIILDMTKDIDKRITEIAKSQNNFQDKKEGEKAKQGDLIVFDYKATIEGKSFEGGEGKNKQIILGKDIFIKDFEKQLKGVSKN